MKTFVPVVSLCALVGCAAAPPATRSPVTRPSAPAPAPTESDGAAASETPERGSNAPWIGAAGASDFVLSGAGETFVGVWVDVPRATRRARAPVALSLVVDTSGSMAGAKIENARLAAKQLVSKLDDGDMVEVTTFSDEARERVTPTLLDSAGRARALSAVAELGVGGGTNMFAGLQLGISRVLAAPPSHSVRRVVVISDGMANIGPSSPEVLGELAARNADQGVQVTSVGVGVDYDERTLDALAVRSSGRLYHLADAREMASILKRELDLLQTTMATDAFVEIVPAPGVQLLGAEAVPVPGAQGTAPTPAAWSGGSLRLPIGTMFGGQHRELLLRARVDTSRAGGDRPLASVRLHFRDPADGSVERIQEVVARYDVTTDPGVVERHANARTRAIAATQDAARVAMRAAESVNAGDYAGAERALASAQTSLASAANRARDGAEKKRLLDAAQGLSGVRAAARSAAAAPTAARPEAQKATAKEINGRAMQMSGY